MVIITVELWPGGDKTKRKILGGAGIANDGTGTETTGNYTAVISTGPNKNQKRDAVVKGFKRKRHNCWSLIAKALADAGYPQGGDGDG